MNLLDPLPCATYWCYEGDVLLYVGQAREPHLRVRQHRSRGLVWAERVTHVEVLWFDCRTDALLMERKATHRDSPLHPSIVDGPRAKASAIASLAADLRLYYDLDHATARRAATKALTEAGYFDGADEPAAIGYSQAEREARIFADCYAALERVAVEVLPTDPPLRRTA